MDLSNFVQGQDKAIKVCPALNLYVAVQRPGYKFFFFFGGGHKGNNEVHV